jgi:hypothetical protein
VAASVWRKLEDGERECGSGQARAQGKRRWAETGQRAMVVISSDAQAAAPGVGGGIWSCGSRAATWPNIAALAAALQQPASRRSAEKTLAPNKAETAC